MSHGNVTKSSRSHTLPLPFWSHPNEIANFDFHNTWRPFSASVWYESVKNLSKLLPRPLWTDELKQKIFHHTHTLMANSYTVYPIWFCCALFRCGYINDLSVFGTFLPILTRFTATGAVHLKAMEQYIGKNDCKVRPFIRWFIFNTVHICIYIHMTRTCFITEKYTISLWWLA